MSVRLPRVRLDSGGNMLYIALHATWWGKLLPASGVKTLRFYIQTTRGYVPDGGVKSFRFYIKTTLGYLQEEGVKVNWVLHPDHPWAFARRGS